jgi:hypothetical protein
LILVFLVVEKDTTMKKIFTILPFVFAIAFSSCTKEKLLAEGGQLNCKQDPPTWCATVRCNPDGKPVCGCDNVNYGSACEAQCAGVTSYTYGTCK